MHFVLHIDGNTTNQQVRKLIDTGHPEQAMDLHMYDQTFELINYLTHHISFDRKLEILAYV